MKTLKRKEMKTLNRISVTLTGACILMLFLGCGCADSECSSAQDKRTLSKVDESEVEEYSAYLMAYFTDYVDDPSPDRAYGLRYAYSKDARNWEA
ncbi:MAG: hypothetical protein ACYSOK_02500, partial [Planctomycetota bacterium]